MYQLYGNGVYDGRFIGYSSAYLPEEEFEQNVDENGEPCYHAENKIQEDSQMSHLVSMKSKYYLIMASDSFHIRGPKTDKHYQKLFPFPGGRSSNWHYRSQHHPRIWFRTGSRRACEKDYGRPVRSA